MSSINPGCCRVVSDRLSRKLYDLHQKCGDLVKVGPNHILIRDLATFYKFQESSSETKRKTYWRSLLHDLYSSISKQSSPIRNVENEEGQHITPNMSLQQLEIDQDLLIRFTRSRETTFNSIISTFCDKLENHYSSKEAELLNLNDYLQLYAYDAAYYVAFSKPPGLMDQGKDAKGIIHAARMFQSQALVVHQAPFYPTMQRPEQQGLQSSSSLFIDHAIEQVAGRALGSGSQSGKSTDIIDAVYAAIEQQCIEAAPRDRQVDSEIFAFPLSCVLAQVCIGAEALTNILAMVFYQVSLPQNQRILERLIAEIDNTIVLRDLTIDRRSNPQSSYFEGFEGEAPLSWDALQHMPYLTAVIKEAMRLQPAIEILGGYDVPDGGLTFSCDGQERHLQEATKVGFSAQAILCNRAIFSSDPDQFIPQRWLAAESVSNETMDECLSAVWRIEGCDIDMVNHLVTHAASKLIPTVLRRFKLSLGDIFENAVDEVSHDALSRVSSLNVLLERRNAA